MATDFRYVPTSGDLSGKSFEEQTQQAINEIGAGSEDANAKAEEAIDLANNAIALAQSAVDTSQAANQAAQDAVATANQANANVQGAYTAAETAQARADQAYTTATTAAETAQNASLDATSATTTASNAAALAQSASDKADTNAENIANLTGTIGSLSSIYVTTADEADLNTLIIPNTKRYFTGTIENSPVAVPAFFYTELNTGSIVCVQTIWNEDTPESIFRRKGVIDYTENSPVPAWQDWKPVSGGRGSGGAVVGMIDLLPFRSGELPDGWYFANGDAYPLRSPQGVVLNGFSENYKADWGIAITGENINLPNLFYTDGRGFYLRSVNGSTRQVGSHMADRFKSHTHTWVHYDTGGSWWTKQGGPINNGNPSSGSYYGTTATGDATETSVLDVGMTPAMYLGV